MIVFASLSFYAMWRLDFCLLVIFSALVDFVCAGRVARTENPRIRMAWLITSLITNIGLLVFFKYTYFIVDNFNLVLSGLGFGLIHTNQWSFSIILPLGISFYTFQTISYTIDVYRKVIRPTDNYLMFLAYVIFWPQLVAGPILRAGEVVAQIVKRRRFSWDNLNTGLWLVLVGLFMKVVVADNIACMVEYWFNEDPSLLTAIDVWVAAFLFGMQIYCDFGGYSSIAIGSAKMLGIHFPDNFNWPYLAKTPKEFWQRWHISLSSWVRDYLYLPLTGEKFRTKSTGGIAVAAEDPPQDARRRTCALILAWFIMGLWHGAAWTFVLWGIYHGFLVLIYRKSKMLKKLPKKLPTLGWWVMLMLVMAGWIVFRSQSLEQACVLYWKLINPLEYVISPRVTGMSSRLAGYSYLWTPILIGGMLVLHALNNRNLPRMTRGPVLAFVRIVSISTMVMMILLCMGARQMFIYFQF